MEISQYASRKLRVIFKAFDLEKSCEMVADVNEVTVDIFASGRTVSRMHTETYSLEELQQHTSNLGTNLRPVPADVEMLKSYVPLLLYFT